MQELDYTKVKAHKLYLKEGEFKAEDGTSFKYKTGTIEFTLGDYPLIFKAKINKELVAYIEDALEYVG